MSTTGATTEGHVDSNAKEKINKGISLGLQKPMDRFMASSSIMSSGPIKMTNRPPSGATKPTPVKGSPKGTPNKYKKSTKRSSGNYSGSSLPTISEGGGKKKRKKKKHTKKRKKSKRRSKHRSKRRSNRR